MSILAQHSETRASQRGTGQFSLRSLFILLTLIAFCTAWLVALRGPLAQFGHYPGVFGLTSIALAIAVPFIARRQPGVSTAWAILTIAVQVTCFNIAYTMLVIVRVTDTTDGVWPRDWMQQTFNGCIASSLTLPLFTILPAIIYLLAFHRSTSRRFGFCLIASVVACALAAAGLTIAMSITFGTLMFA